ncbi:BBP7 family outer membrane beta-barrel protein [Rhodopirellula sp. MGV]|uniref:BBP7 family outer membrane beta-barrel protein n=1 Tax=Rhodopirellula sp. MGV TaxID=2023130 RepID=UPI000B95E090|nr:BBP7 family outer membrane beta-barrel protein [Rhodopirellula sp. MGV]OYP39073.1 hypothetical protein CGZ80_00010 [Rhodopirellula sp. MGV]PNY35550.1 hypothetical protein C2E31_18840 [Rhodopirellula baltica]
MSLAFNRLQLWVFTFALGISGACLLETPEASGQTPPSEKRIASDVESNRVTWRVVSSKQNSATEKKNRSTHAVSAAKYEPSNSDAMEPVAEVSHGEVIYDESFYSGGCDACDSMDGACDSIGCGACDGMGCRIPKTRIRAPFSHLNYRIQADYLLWSLGGADLPPLVTTSPVGTPAANAGVLNQSGTSVLFGGDTIGDQMRSGMRLSLQWDDRCGTEGFDLSFLGVFEDSETFNDSRAVLARPVFDTGTGSESALLIAHPDFLTGSVNAEFQNSLFAFDVMRRQRICTAICDHLDLSFGYRHGRLDESLSINQQSTFTQAQGPILAGTTRSLSDIFETDNRFHGAQFGLRYQSRYGNGVHLTANAKVAFGVNQAEARISGQTTTTVPGAGSSSINGGLLAQSTNIGTHEQSDFSVIPELGINLSTYLDRNLQVGIGYNLLVWTNAIQVDDAIDRTVSQFPPELPTGTRNPAFNFDSGTFIAHGLSFNAMFNF